MADEVESSWAASTKSVYASLGQNSGNLAFHYALNRIFGGSRPSLPWHTDPLIINNSGDVALIPCANQLGPHADLGRLASNFARLTIPVLAIGLGAQSNSDYGVPEVPEGTRNWIREINRCSPTDGPNIGVRGQFTLNVLKHYGLDQKAIVTGCPTLFINPDPELGKKIEAKSNHDCDFVVVAAGHQQWRHLAGVENSLGNIIDQTCGSYIVQSPIEMVALARGEIELLGPGALDECRTYVRPLLTEIEFLKWAKRHFRLFCNVSAWMEYVRPADFVLGTRIHGVMLGLQAGIPSLCIAHDSRTRELCELMMVPFIMASEIPDDASLEFFKGKFEFDGRAFDENRRNLARNMADFISSNLNYRSKVLENIASS